jgi:maspardin
MPTHIDHALFDQCYANVDNAQRRSLFSFRTQHTIQEGEYDGALWQYVTLGKGDSTVIFLPGAIGNYYIWWQQLLALSEDLRLISFSYPSLGSMECVQSGLNAVLRKEGIDRFHIIGSSMGGYIAQYLASTQPERLLSATFANSFVPTLPFLRTAPFLRVAIRIFPLAWIHSIYQWFSQLRLVPAGEYDPLLEAYLMEVRHAGLNKADFLARLSCVSQKFKPIQLKDQTFPILIIDSDNDPLIRPRMRQAVREIYPTTQRYTFKNAGHFPYLNQPETYTNVIRSFILSS